MNDPSETKFSGHADPRLKVLPDDPDAFAQLVLTNLKKRSRLEYAASKSMWTRTRLGKLGMTFFPVTLFWVLFAFRESLEDYLPFIFVFLLFIIQGVIASIHQRIDAVYELMKMGPPEIYSKGNQTEQNAAEQPTKQPTKRPESK